MNLGYLPTECPILIPSLESDLPPEFPSKPFVLFLEIDLDLGPGLESTNDTDDELLELLPENLPGLGDTPLHLDLDVILGLLDA